MKALVIGAGMYVTGRGADTDGTILPALYQLSCDGLIDEIVVVASNPDNGAVVETVGDKLSNLLGAAPTLRYENVDRSNIESEIAKLNATSHFDCAIVSTPDPTHYSIVSSLMSLKLPTLVVKPFVTALADGVALMQQQEETGVIGQVEFHKRYDESNLLARRYLNANAIGKISYFNVDYSQRITIPTETFRAWAADSNIFQYLAVHYVDLIYFLTGCRPVRLTATATRHRLTAMGIDTPDSIHVMIEWASETGDQSFIANINCNWIDPATTSAMSDQKFMIVGTGGRLTCDQKHRGIELVTEDGIRHPNPYFSDYLESRGQMRFQGYGFKSIEYFIRDVDKGEEQTAGRPTFREALVAQAVLETVNRAIDAPPAWHEIPSVNA